MAQQRIIETVGRSDGEYHKKLRIVGKDKVALHADQIRTERIQGGIFLLEKYDINCRTNKYQITDLGSRAKEETGLQVGDYVCADQLARFYDTFPVSVIKFDSIIFKFKDKDSDEIEPLNGMVFVKPDKPKEEDIGGFIKLTDLLPVGTITHINATGIKGCDLKIVENVLLTNNGDNVYYKGQQMFIYKINVLDAIIEEEE